MKNIPLSFLALSSLLCLPFSALAQTTTTVRVIAFPTDPSAVTFIDDFGQERAGHPHEGNDMLGPKMTPLYAAVDGRVS